MDAFLDGKRALVTGGTRGIGRAIVAALAGAGARVALCGRSREAVDQVVREFAPRHKVLGEAADVGSGIEVDRLLRTVEREFQGLDILVNNAGIGHFAAAGAVEPQDWDRVLATNLTGVFQCCRGALPLMRAAGAGHIINVSSLAGKNAFAGGAVYNASKFGLNGFTEALMLDYRYENIRVGLIAPGSVDAEFSPRRTPEADSGDAEWKIAPEDVAEAVLGMLRMPPRTTVSLIEVRPSKPKRR